MVLTDRGQGPHDGADPFPGAARRPDSRLHRAALRPLDLLLPAALVLWWIGVHSVQPTALNDYGLLPALPVIFFVGLGVLVGSIVRLILQDQLSPVRLGLHLLGLVVVLHGTVPIIFTVPNYPWVYKHIGVVNYISLHGSVDSSVDIYQNWPGFFALAAWFTRVAGVGSPLTYAAWAPVYFNLLICLELAFVFRWLPVTRRVRWLALFLFVAGNWVGQDYFAPQALAFVLSLAVFGMVLMWFQVDRPPAVVRGIRRLASHAKARRVRPLEPDGALPRTQGPARGLAPLSARSRMWTVVFLFATFAAVVVSHQLSPYVIVLGVGLLTVAGMVRPRCLVLGLVAVAIGYLLLHLPYIERTQDLFASLGDPLKNVHSSVPNDSVAMKGRELTAVAAPALVVGMWALGMLGVLRRLRTGRTVLVVALLAASPALVAVGQSYGGEAVFRIYLFSLPWIAVLAASALDPGPRHWPLWSAAKVAVVLSVTLALFMSAFFGAEELYLVRPGEVAASQYFYEHAEPDSVFFTVTALMFPIRVSGNYDKFRAVGDNPPNLLTTVKQFRHRMLGTDDLPAISAFVDHYVSGGAPGRYLVLSTGQDIYARVLGLLPPGSMANLEQALAGSPNWSVWYRNSDAVIYQSRSAADQPAQLAAPVAPTRAVERAGSKERSLDRVAIATGLLGMCLIVLIWKRRRAMAAVHVDEVVLNEEEMMHSSAATEVLEPETDSQGASEPEREPEPEPGEVTVPTDIDDLVRQALLTPATAREPFRLALRNREPEPARFRELVGGVELAKRSDAVRLLGEAWGPVSLAQVRPLLDDLSGSVRAAAATVLDLSPEAVAELHRLLRDDLSCAVRVAALRALAEAPEEDQWAALSVALSDPEPEVRTCAIETLPVAGTARAMRSVLAASEDQDEQVRNAAYRRLATAEPWMLWMAIDHCSRVEQLCAVLRQDAPAERLAALVQERISSPEPRDRTLALELAGVLETPGWVDESVNALQDPEAAVRRVAVAQLRGRPETGPGDRPETGPGGRPVVQVVGALVTALQDDPDPVVRAGAASALDGVEIDNALLAFIGALQDPDADVRNIASEALVRRSSPGLARRVAIGLTIANSSSVGRVLVRMGNVGEDALVAAAVEGPRDRASAAAQLLNKTGKVKGLLGNLGAVEPTTRLRAVEALGALGGPDALRGLVTALADSWPGIRSRAAFHLGQMGDEAGSEPLQRLLERDQSPDVLRAAGEALRTIDNRDRQAGVSTDGA